MYAIRLELKTNWRFIFNNKCFFHSLRKGRQVLKRKITVPQIHIYTLIAIIPSTTYQKDTEKENQSIITGDAKGIK